MPHRFVACDTSESQPAKSLGDLYSGGSFINASAIVEIRLGPIVVAVARQVICDPHQHASQPAIGVPDDRAPIVVGLIALMSGRIEAATEGYRIGVGVPRDRARRGLIIPLENPPRSLFA